VRIIVSIGLAATPTLSLGFRSSIENRKMLPRLPGDRYRGWTDVLGWLGAEAALS